MGFRCGVPSFSVAGAAWFLLALPGNYALVCEGSVGKQNFHHHSAGFLPLNVFGLFFVYESNIDYNPLDHKRVRGFWCSAFLIKRQWFDKPDKCNGFEGKWSIVLRYRDNKKICLQPLKRKRRKFILEPEFLQTCTNNSSCCR